MKLDSVLLVDMDPESIQTEPVRPAHSITDGDIVGMIAGFEHAGSINYAVCLALALPLNGLLVWVVARRSPDELRVYKKVLLFTSALDTLFVTLTFAVQPFIITVRGTMLQYGVGPLMSWEGAHTWNSRMIVAWPTSLGLVHYAIPVPFVYRYMLLCWGNKLNTLQYLLLLCLSCALSCSVMLPVLLNRPTDQR